MSDESTLDFSFNNISDVELPPTAGFRTVRFDEAPTIGPNTNPNNKGGPLIIQARAKICDGGQGVYPVDENDRMIFVRFDPSSSQDQIRLKRMFLAARVEVPNGAKFEVLRHSIVGKTAQIEFKHSNVNKDGKVTVYGNVRDWMVPGDMIKQIGGAKPEPVPAVG